ncbi:hypothetical protein Pyrfu_0485 [Pyrolobus fumarii 1A]|uniref:CRISPR-associated protein n=1 Tax=Pyrolobus fumarii (strain DSM 11204 / 1A) TaxID=694429 RepID=G0EGI2_PYRF1|nr:CRISPR-associated ring nuclease [Pyrolobus fumarii]AEM38356.1 hypothetical protein Pyrfu_0485 [Pyrolobus fumarii 1A]
MGTRLVVLLGMSPGVLHTVLCALRANAATPTEVHIVATRRAPVHEAIEIARTCPCPGTDKPPLAPSTTIHVHALRVDDVTDEEGINELLEKLEEATRGAKHAIIDVTGGRKLASIIAAMYSVRRGYTTIYTPIPHEEQQRINRAETLCDKTTRTPPKPITL